MFVDYEHTTRKYASISAQLGGIVEEVDANTRGARSRVNKNNRTVWELVHPAVCGYIQGIRLKESKDYGNKYDIAIESPRPDSSGVPLVIHLQFQQDSYTCRALLNSLITLSAEDFSFPVTISTKRKKYQGKDFFFVNVFRGERAENSTPVEPKYDKAALPQPKKFVIKGKDVYDYTEAQEMIERHISEMVHKIEKGNSLRSLRRGPVPPSRQDRNFRDEDFGDPQTEEVDGSHYISDEAPESAAPEEPDFPPFDIPEGTSTPEPTQLPLHASADEKRRCEAYRETCRKLYGFIKGREKKPEESKGCDAWSPAEWAAYNQRLHSQAVEIVKNHADLVLQTKGKAIFSDKDMETLGRLATTEATDLIAFAERIDAKDEIPF